MKRFKELSIGSLAHKTDRVRSVLNKAVRPSRARLLLLGAIGMAAISGAILPGSLSADTISTTVPITFTLDNPCTPKIETIELTGNLHLVQQTNGSEVRTLQDAHFSGSDQDGNKYILNSGSQITVDINPMGVLNRARLNSLNPNIPDLDLFLMSRSVNGNPVVFVDRTECVVK